MGDVVRISDVIEDRGEKGRFGWAVMAAFVRGPLGEPVCVDYRVRALPDDPLSAEWVVDEQELTVDQGVIGQTVETMGTHTEGPWPGGDQYSVKGIPSYVFTEASQVKLIEKARAALATDRVTEGPAADLLASGVKRKPGRPSKRPLLETLRILRTVEQGYAAGQTLQEIADSLHLSRSTVRDVLARARDGANPLFEAASQTRRGGRMTPAARAALKQLEDAGE